MNIRNTSVLLLAAASILLFGCNSDPVAPRDEPPPLQPAGAAAQAGYMSRMVTELANLRVFGVATKDSESQYTFQPPSDVSGTVLLSYRAGGAAGTPAEPADADFCLGRTAPTAPLQLVYGEDTNVTYELTFEITADNFIRTLDSSDDVDQMTLNSTRPGTFRAGTYVANWTLQNLVVDTNQYPASGVVIFTVMGFDCEVTFLDGGSTATITVGADIFHVNLATGLIVS